MVTAGLHGALPLETDTCSTTCVVRRVYQHVVSSAFHLAFGFTLSIDW